MYFLRCAQVTLGLAHKLSEVSITWLDGIIKRHTTRQQKRFFAPKSHFLVSYIIVTVGCGKLMNLFLLD